MQEFTLSIQSFAMCSPATGSIPSLGMARNMTWGNDHKSDSWLPDMSFLPKHKFRRLGRMSKMGMYSAYYASLEAGGVRIGAPIFCSRMGELQHTTNVLNAIYSNDLVSPMDFSYAVHNTGQGLFSILSKDQKPATALCAREGVVEQALVKAYAQICGGDEAVLMVYQDDVLPEVYQPFLRHQLLPLSFAVVVRRGNAQAGPQVTLSYEAYGGKQAVQSNDYNNIHEQNLAQILAAGHGNAEARFNRLSWEWHCDTSTA